MYVRTSEGLGQTIIQGPTTIKRNGHERIRWSLCTKEGTRQRRCGIWLKVKFRQSFGDFRKEVERAFRSWMSWPRARTLIKKREGMLKTFHKTMMDSKKTDNVPVELGGTFIYRGPDGPKQEWRIVDFQVF